MKVAILSINDLRHITMIKIYTEFFEANNIQYDIICTERYGDNPSFNNARIYFFRIPEMGSNKTKYRHFFMFRNYAISVLKKNKYDFVVSWGEYTSVLFSDYLIKQVSYSVNIRDVSFPSNPVFRSFFWTRLSKAVKHSCFSTWCAQRGQEFLPKHNYIIVLNQNKELVNGARKRKKLVDKGNPIHIGVVGYIRHIEASKRLMDCLRNDDRFVLQFFGTGAERLIDYANEIQMKNIEICGTFKPEETKSLLDKIDVLNVYYGDGREEFAMSLGSPIRYGYSSMLYIPAIVSPDTYLSERTTELNTAFTINNLSSFPDDFYEWYYSLVFEDFKTNCDIYNKEFDDSISRFHSICRDVFLSQKGV